MKAIFKTCRSGLSILLMTAGLSAMAAAQCATPVAKYHKQAWRIGDPAPSLIQTADAVEPIVGMWHVTFTAKGNADGPPDGTVIDNALLILHSDGTEVMNSARPPQDGNICIGVWEKTGRNTYRVNHLPWAGNDTTNAPTGIGNPTGPTRIVETITVSADGNGLSGRFLLRASDTSGKITANITGVLSATRVTIHTTIQDLL